MKRILLLLQILAMVLILSVTFAAAKNENAALVIKIPNPVLPEDFCVWDYNIQGLVGEGSVHYVETQNGKWKLSCHGEVVEGLPIKKAVIAHSTADNPIGECFTPFGSTFDWHLTYSPSASTGLN
jgi:hypothetical protein